MIFFDVPRTGWFESTDPVTDYRSLKKIADRSAVGDAREVEMLDLVGLEDDFRRGKYPWRDYYEGFLDGDGRSERAKNAIHDLNSYLRALRSFEHSRGSLDGLAAVRFHQNDGRIDSYELIERPSKLSDGARVV